MALVESLLTAIVRADGDALVLHVGERPYVVAASGQVELSTRTLTLEAISGILGQLISPAAEKSLEELVRSSTNWRRWRSSRTNALRLLPREVATTSGWKFDVSARRLFENLRVRGAIVEPVAAGAAASGARGCAPEAVAPAPRTGGGAGGRRQPAKPAPREPPPVRRWRAKKPSTEANQLRRPCSTAREADEPTDERNRGAHPLGSSQAAARR